MTNTKENGLQAMIVSHLRDVHGYVEGDAAMYDKSVAIVKPWLEAFLKETQPKEVAAAAIFSVASETAKFYARLSAALAERGVSDVLRKGFKHNGQTLKLYCELPDALNETAKANYAKNRFGVIKELKYSHANENALDVVTFVNGLPVATFELKNHYTNQTAENAIAQYQNDRDPNEILFKKKRCAVHFAVDDTDVFMCTELKGKESWFLPFNRGYKGGKGNPPADGKTMTSYLWEDVLERRSLSNILENYAQVVTETDKKTKKVREKVVWPRYHQLDAVRKLIVRTAAEPVGRRFLVQHSAGSGKSNTITWLAYQLVMVKEAAGAAKFDSVIVVTDRINLDRQIRDNINGFRRLSNVVGWAEHSSTLKELLVGGKKIIVSTVFKFSYILDEIGGVLKDRHFAIVIDEAHSSQNGQSAGGMAACVSGNGDPNADADDIEEKVYRLLKGRKLAKNANYYAFTATPKNKTLEMFGERHEGPKPEDPPTFTPFHEYTMRQAIEEGFILDVIRFYTPYNSYYRIVKAFGADAEQEFDKKKAPKKIRAYIEAHPQTVEDKAEVIVSHFCAKVFKKIGGKARAMVVTSSIERAISFFKAISKLLEAQGGKYKAIVAFTDKVIDGRLHTESMYNNFPSSQLEDKVEEDPYRILVVADKFQTGYDQPLLHTMYVDKVLTDVKAVQTLSRLNRTLKNKTDTFVLDFANDPEDVRQAFQRYYKTTVLTGESDVNKLEDLIAAIEKTPCYTEEQLEDVVRLKLSGKDEDRQQIDSELDFCVVRFKEELDEDAQVRVKGAMKNFCRVYPFFASIMPFESETWEKRFLFYALLVKKLPKLVQEDFTQGLIETIDFDKYRLVKEEERAIVLQDEDARVDPVPTGKPGGKGQVEMDTLANIVDDFNRAFGGIEWKNADEVKCQIKTLPARLLGYSLDFVNAVRSGDKQASQILFDASMREVVTGLGLEKVEFMQCYLGNESFRNVVNRAVYEDCVKRIANGEPI